MPRDDTPVGDGQSSEFQLLSKSRGGRGMQRGWTRQDWNGRVRDDIMWTQILYKWCSRTSIEDPVPEKWVGKSEVGVPS